MAFGKLFATKTCTIRKKALTLQSETQTVKNKIKIINYLYHENTSRH